MESMNLAESMKYVLKNRSGDLFSSFWKSDLKLVFHDVKKDLSELMKSGFGKISSLKNQSVKETFIDIKDSTVDSVTIFKVVPSRIRQGFIYFQQDLMDGMDELPQQKDKTLFCLKVIGVLSSFTLKTLYGVKQSRADLQFKGLRIKSAVTQMLATELLVRIIQVFTVRLINEIEKQMDNDEEIKKLNYFKSLLSSGHLSENENLPDPESADKAFAIVESFKTFILTGKRIVP